MADLVSGGSATLSGVATAATPRVEWWRIVPLLPNDHGVAPVLNPTVSLRLSTWDGDDQDVQVQIATGAAFSNIVFDSTITDVDGENVVPGTMTSSSLTNGSTYWWRARTVPVTGDVPPWTTPRQFKIDVHTGDAIAYVDENVGFVLVPNPGAAAEFVNMNVGVLLVRDGDAVTYVDYNVGVRTILAGIASEDVHYGDASTNTPTPHIWFLRPATGRPGDGILIVGFGFGDLQDTYDGVVEMDLGGGDWEGVSITSWQSFPPTIDAYTPDRVLDEVLGLIDQQHTTIGFLVPSTALPPGYPIRVRTEGP